MNNEINRLKILSSIIWKFLEQGGTQGVQFIVSIVLARLLTPEDYGLIAIVIIFITIANVFIQSGFNTALIQKKNADEIDFSSILYLNLFVAGLLYVILYFISPFIAKIYKEPQIILIIRVLSVTLIFGAFNSIQNAYIARNMMFKKLFFSSFGSILISGSIGIVGAYVGFGVWALVVQQLINQLLITLILWFTIKWRPKLIFSFKRVRGLFSFGWRLLAARLIDTIYTNSYSLIIGKMFSPVMLGFYNRGDQFPKFIVSNINGSIQSVMLPVLSSQQENKIRIKDMVRKTVIISSFFIVPMMVGLAILAEPFVEIILTPKWVLSIPFVRIFCAYYALWPLHTANLQAINALGRTDVFLKLEIIKKSVGILILLMSLPFGIHAIAWGIFFGGFISVFINAYPNTKLLDYKYKEQLLDIMPIMLLSFVMGIIVNNIKRLELGKETTMLLQIILGAGIYFGLAKFLKLKCLTYIINVYKSIIKNQSKD